MKLGSQLEEQGYLRKETKLEGALVRTRLRNTTSLDNRRKMNSKPPRIRRPSSKGQTVRAVVS